MKNKSSSFSADNVINKKVNDIVSTFDNSTLFESEIEDTDFKGVFLATLMFSNIGKLDILSKQTLIKPRDIKKIRDYNIKGEVNVFREGFYRLDLSYCILLYKRYNCIDGVLYLGHLLEKNVQSRILLLEERQQYLEEQMKLL